MGGLDDFIAFQAGRMLGGAGSENERHRELLAAIKNAGKDPQTIEKERREFNQFRFESMAKQSAWQKESLFGDKIVFGIQQVSKEIEFGWNSKLPEVGTVVVANEPLFNVGVGTVSLNIYCPHDGVVIERRGQIIHCHGTAADASHRAFALFGNFSLKNSYRKTIRRLDAVLTHSPRRVFGEPLENRVSLR